MRRAGKPWSAGSGSRFMPTAIIGSRPGAIAHEVGNPTVKPSTERPTICVAPGWTPAVSSTSFSRTPVHSEFPTRCPPTRLLTQEIVTYCS